MSDRLLSGLVHELRGRATAFGGLGQLLGDEDLEPEWFRDQFTAELARMEEAVELLGLLRGDPTRESEPLSLAEALPGILSLWSRASGQPLPVTLERDDDAPPIRVSWPGLRQALLTLLHEADDRARAQGAEALALELTARDRDACIRLAWSDAHEAEEGRDRISALSELFQALGGRLLVREEGPWVEARFPGLGSG